MSTYAKEQVLERVERLAREGLDVASFLSEAGAVLDRAVPSGIEATPAPTWMTLDPASLVFTSVFSEGCTMPWTAQDMVWLEYSSEMAGNRVGDVVREPRGVQTLRQLVEADPGGAGGYLELLRSMGTEHEALVALRARDGQHWGAVYLAREPGRPDFSPEELDFLRAVAPHLAEGIRRGMLAGEAAEPEASDAPAIVVLAEDLTVESSTPGAQHWMSDLPVLTRGELPTSVLSVAQVALAGRDEVRRGDKRASVWVHSERRGWVMLHGQTLAGSGGRRVASSRKLQSVAAASSLLECSSATTSRASRTTTNGSGWTDPSAVAPSPIPPHSG